MASGEPLKGVNLGGWLVLEKWMTPSLFAGCAAVDEYTFCAAGAPGLRRHRDTFITEADFKWLAAHGVEAVRLPVGYWVFGDADPYARTLPYVDKAFRWAEKHGIKVLLGLHGAPGSQNGNDHSGQIGSVDWPLTANQELTIRILMKLAERYGRHPALLGIYLLNEPSPNIAIGELEQFYERAAVAIRPLCREDAWLVFHDSFRPKLWRKRLIELYHDHHHYQLFGNIDKWLPVSLQLLRARYVLPFKIGRMRHHHPVIIGEWSLALRSEKMSRVKSTLHGPLIRRYARDQLQAFQSVDAWFYWSYKTEAGGSWSFRSVIEKRLLRLQ